QNTDAGLPAKADCPGSVQEQGERSTSREYKATREEEIVRILRTFLPERGMYVIPDLPQAKLPAIRAKLGLFLDRILGLIEPCFLFGSTGIYSCNDEFTDWNGFRNWRTGQEVVLPKVGEACFRVAYDEFASRVFD